MTPATFFIKARNRLHYMFLKRIRTWPVYPMFYSSWWNATFASSNETPLPVEHWLAAVPNPSAGIGHQLANWISGYWHARQFGLGFAHVPFSDPKWERLLGFSRGETTAEALILGGCRKIKLPLFDEFDPDGRAMILRIVRSYRKEPVVFFLEQDQGYRDQFGVRDDIQDKFWSSVRDNGATTRYDASRFNIAVHVRRGDIVAGLAKGDANLSMRFQSAKYFDAILEQVVPFASRVRPISIWVFSQGMDGEFEEFAKHGDLHMCTDMDQYESFLHLASADLLVTSKSSFSYKPALLSHGVKICPRDFWHGYPDDPSWILAGSDGCIDSPNIDKLRSRLLMESHQLVG